MKCSESNQVPLAGRMIPIDLDQRRCSRVEGEWLRLLKLQERIADRIAAAANNEATTSAL
jgi:hypothetical protein